MRVFARIRIVGIGHFHEALSLRHDNLLTTMTLFVFFLADDVFGLELLMF